MKEKNFNALIAAGCLTLLAPMSASATDYENITVPGTVNYNTNNEATLNLDSGANTFNTIEVSPNGNNDSTFVINASNGSLSINQGQTGAVTLKDKTTIEFSDAVKQITVGTVVVKGENGITGDAVNSGNIKMDKIQLDGSATKLTLTDVKTDNYKSIVNSSNNNLAIDLQNSDLKTVDIKSGQEVTVTSIQDKKSTASNLSLNAGTNNNATKLKVQARYTDTNTNDEHKSELSVDKIELNNYSDLILDTVVSSETSTTKDGKLTLNDVEIKGTNIVIENKNKNTNSQSTTVINTNSGSSATVKGLAGNTSINMSGNATITSETNKSSIATLNVEGEDNTFTNKINETEISLLNVSADENNLSDLTIDAEADTKIGSANISGETDGSNFALLTLNANNGDITQTDNNTVTLSDGGYLVAKADSSKKVTLNGVNVNDSSNNVIEKDSDNVDTVNFGTISMSDSVLTVVGIEADDHTFVFNGTNTLTAENNTELGNLPVEANQTLDIYSKDDGTTFNAATLEAGTNGVTTLNLNAKPSATSQPSEYTQITGKSITMNGNGAVNFTGGQIQLDAEDAEDPNDVFVNVNGKNNTLTNTSNNSVTVNGDLVFGNTETQDSEVTLNGDFSFKAVDFNGKATLNTQSGKVQTGNINIDSLTDSIVINATNASNTNVGTLNKLADSSVINATFNADETSTISQTGNITLSTYTPESENATTYYDTLTLNGEGDINLGNVVADGGHLYGNNKNTTISKLTFQKDESSTTTDVKYSKAFDTADDKYAKIKITNVDVNDLGDDYKPTWNLNFNSTAKTSDTLVLSDDVIKALNGKGGLDFKLKQDDKRTDFYVDYIKLVDNDTSVLANTDNPTKEDDNYVRYVTDEHLVPQFYYSYAQGVEDQDFLPNTVLITNYNINDNDLLHEVLKPGERTFILPEGIEGTTPITYDHLPNMQALEGKNNVLTLSGVSSISGTTEDGLTSQIFMLDSREDNLARTLNVNGTSINNGESNVDNYTTGNGAALQAYSNSEENSGKVTVNLNPYYKVIGLTPAEMEGHKDAVEAFKNSMQGKYDNLNPDSYVRLENGDKGTDVKITKDVAFYGNKVENNGGAVYLEGKNTTVNAYSVKKDGSGIDDGVTFTKNHAGANGGAIALADGATYHAIQQDNYIIPGSDGTPDKSTGASYMDQNSAGGQGGSVYITNGSKFITDGDFTSIQSTSVGNGGAIANNQKSELQLAQKGGKVTFWRNVAGNAENQSSGGAIYNDNATAVIGSTTGKIEFAGNEAFGNGGVHASVNNALTVKGDSITYGGTYEGKEPYTPYDGKVTGNIAGGNGGAVSAINSTVNIEGNTVDFNNNISQGKGGAIYIKGSDKKRSTVNINATDTAKFNDNIQDATFKTAKAGEGDALCGHVIDKKTGLHAHDGGESNAAFLDGNATLNLSASTLELNDKITAENNNNIININTKNADLQETVSAVGNDNTIFITGTDTLNVEAPVTAKGDNNDISINGTGTTNIDAPVSASGSDNVVSLTNSNKGITNVNDVISTDGKNNVINLTANKGTMKLNDNVVANGEKDTINLFNSGTMNVNKQVVTNGKNDVVNVSSAGKTTFNDKLISNGENSEVNLTTSGKGTINFNKKIESPKYTVITQNGQVYYNVNNKEGFNGKFDLNSGDAYFTTKASVPFNNVDYRLNGGSTFHMYNGVITPIKAKSLDLTGTSPLNPAKITIDMDLSKEVADRFQLSTESNGGNILVTDINTMGSTDKQDIFFNLIEQPKDSKAVVDVQSSVKKIHAQDKDLTEFDVMGKPNGLLVHREKTSDDTALYSPLIAVNARLAGQLDLYNDVLHRVDEIAETRYFHKVQRNNLYAGDPDVLDDRRIDNGYTPYVNQEDGGCTWLKGHATIEHISPSGHSGYKNRNYNAFIGYETPVGTMKNGWDIINTFFGGYQGSYQDYDNIQNYQNGGSGGYMANLYHNNFFAGGVVMMGGTNVDTKDDGQWNRNMNYGLFDIGAGARVGYNVGLGKHWLFQPMLTTSYIYITGIHRHNTRGEEINMKGTNTIQVAPGFKIVGNYRGWQPYVLFDYTWPILAKTVANVNDTVDLDDVTLRSYVEYGVGLRKNFGERFVGHVEAVMRNGGRTGLSFQGGLVFKF